MTPTEALQVWRIATALAPAQRSDELTPDAWAGVLRNVRYEDAQLALEQLGAEQEWIHVSHIVRRVKRIRAQRLSEFGLFPNPPHPMEQSEYREWLHATRTAIADGTLSPESAAPARIVSPATPERRALLRGAARPVEEA